MPKKSSRIIGIGILIFTLFYTQNAQAQEGKFETEYDVVYKINPNGITEITKNISIINKQSDVVATNYSLTVTNMDIYDVKGVDADGELEIKLDSTGNSTKIKTQFNDQVIGIDRKLDWTLSYKTKDIATKVGEIWNINIPRVEVLDATNKYDVTLIVPAAFGSEIYISPQPLEKHSDEKGLYEYKFNKEILMQKGVTASFGEYQIINFKLNYNLKNDGTLSSYQDIALPPTIRNKQQVQYLSLEPTPIRIFNDKDGNLMATYEVKGKSDLEVNTFGSARVSGTQINPEFGGKTSDIPQELINAYTKADKFWEVNSEAIKKVADDLYSVDLTTSQNAQNVYNYVVNKLEYNLDATNKDYIDRNGALNALVNTGPWACMEFTDLFIAITRAMGIPTRELNGYALTHESNLTPLSISLKGGDLLHSWPEFYDPNFGWVQIDPTWGNTSKTDYFTKLDTNHFVFVIKGYDSEYPYPAGTYKISGDEKQVEVAVAQETPEDLFKESVLFYPKRSLNPFKLISGNKTYTIYNDSGIKIYNLNNSGKDLNPLSYLTLNVDKKDKKVSYENYYGETKYFDLKEEKGKNPAKNYEYTTIFVSVFLALLLCSLIYVLAIRPEFLQKLLPHRLRRPQDPDRSQNQNSQ